jgi:hypothetical protein
MSWLVIGGVAALLLVAGIDALRSGFTESSAPTVPTERSVPCTAASTGTLGPSTTLSTESLAPAESGPGFTMMGSSPRIREYVAHAVAICAGANSGLATVGFSGGQGEWELAAAAASEWALENLRALPRPPGDRVLLDEFFSAAQRELEALRTAAAVSAAGPSARILATHEKDAVADRLAARWHVRPRDLLRACPVSLPA